MPYPECHGGASSFVIVHYAPKLQIADILEILITAHESAKRTNLL